MPGMAGKGADTQSNALRELSCGNRASQFLFCTG